MATTYLATARVRKSPCRVGDLANAPSTPPDESSATAPYRRSPHLTATGVNRGAPSARPVRALNHIAPPEIATRSAPRHSDGHRFLRPQPELPRFLPTRRERFCGANSRASQPWLDLARYRGTIPSAARRHRFRHRRSALLPDLVQVLLVRLDPATAPSALRIEDRPYERPCRLRRRSRSGCRDSGGSGEAQRSGASRSPTRGDRTCGGRARGRELDRGGSERYACR